MKYIPYILSFLFLGFAACSAGTGLAPTAETQTTPTNPFPPLPAPIPVRKVFTCSVTTNPSPAVVSTFGDPATGNLAPSSVAPAVEYRILGSLDGVATLVDVAGVSLDSTAVSQVIAPVEQLDKSYVASYRPIRGGTHNITFNIVVRGDASYAQSCASSVQLNLTVPPALATNIDATPTVVPNGGFSTLSMSSANADGCDIYKDFLHLNFPPSITMQTFSSGQLFNPTAVPITTAYRSVCHRAGQPDAEDIVEITINPAPTAALGIVSGMNLVDTVTIGVNGSVQLRWESTYANACSIRDQNDTLVGNDPLPTASGNITVNLIPASRTFTLTCRDLAMTQATDQVQVNVAMPGVTFNITSDAAITKTGNDHQLSNGATFYRVDFTAVDVVANGCQIAEGLVNVTSQIPKTVSTTGMAAMVTYTATCTSLRGGTISATAIVKKPPCSGTTSLGLNSNGKWDPFVIRGFVQTNETVTPNISNSYAANFDAQTAARICSFNPLHKAVVEFVSYDSSNSSEYAYKRSGYDGGGPMKGWNGSAWVTMSNKWIAKLICGCQ